MNIKKWFKHMYNRDRYLSEAGAISRGQVYELQYNGVPTNLIGRYLLDYEIPELTENEISTFIVEHIVKDTSGHHGAGLMWFNTTTKQVELWNGQKKIIIYEDILNVEGID